MMEKFRYRAFSPAGERVSGTEEAATRGAAHLALLDRGFQSVEMTEKNSILKFEITKKRVPRKDIMHFSRQLGVFVKAGIPIMEALEVISEETTDKLLKAALLDMIERLQAGDTFASAAAAHPEAFPDYYLGILGSAELTGTLDVVLEQLADYIERDVDARGKITGALIYPAVVFVMAIVTVVILAAFVLPRFKTFFDSFHATLPLPTRMLLSVSNFISNWWWALLLGIVALIVGAIVTRRSQRGRAWLDSVMLKLPVLGDLIQAVIMERICRILSSMIHAGVALPDAMAVTAAASNNAVYKQGLDQVREEMMEGQGLSEPIARTGLFPGAARQMFRVGEETGTLDEQLDLAGTYYNREVDIRVKRFTSLFEPAVIIFMGLIVGFVAVALVSAMYGIYHQVHIQ
jgi:type IV pilus assembly protein PilC